MKTQRDKGMLGVIGVCSLLLLVAACPLLSCGSESPRTTANNDLTQSPWAQPQDDPAREGVGNMEQARAARVPGLILSPAVVEARTNRDGAPQPQVESENPENRARERYEQRLGDGGYIPANALIEAKRQAERMPVIQVQRDAGIWDWEWLGPGNIGGRIRSILIHPTDPNEMWVGGVSGGIWHTTDGGDEWQPVDDFLPSLAIGSMAMHPTDPNTMYAGTGEGFSSGYFGIHPGAGVFKSIDGGQSWDQLEATIPDRTLLSGDTQPGDTVIDVSSTAGFAPDEIIRIGELHTSGGAGTGVYRILAVPNENQLTLAGPVGLVFSAGTQVRSTWRYVNRLAIAPLEPRRIVAATADALMKSFNSGQDWLIWHAEGSSYMDVKISPDDSRLLASTLDGRLFYSDWWGDPDLVWGPLTEASGLPPEAERIELAFAPSNPNIVYASVNYVLNDDYADRRVYVSLDQGESFPHSVLSTTLYGMERQGNFNNALWVSPDDSNVIVVGGVELMRTLDGGANWERISDRTEYHRGLSAHADHHIIVEHPFYDIATNRTVFFGNDGGIQKTDDIYAVTEISGWENLANNLGITQFYAGAAAPTGNMIIGGTQDNATVRFNEGLGAQHWYQAFERGDGGFCAIDFNNPSICYTEHQGLRIMRSTDQGGSYEEAFAGLADAWDLNPAHPYHSLFIAPFVMDPTNSHRLIAGGESIWETNDMANSWHAINGPVGIPIPFCSAIDIRPVAGAAHQIWTGYHDGQLRRSLVNGVPGSWDIVDDNASTNPLPDRWITDIAVNPDPNTPGEVFVTIGGYASDTVWFTSDGGANWELRTGSGAMVLPDIHVNTVRFHPVQTNWVYVGTDLGVYASEDKGLTWSQTPRYGDHEGPVNTIVDELFWQGDAYLIAATHGRGMYRTRPLPGAVFVDWRNDGYEDGTEAHPYNTVAEGITAAQEDTAILIANGEYVEDAPITFSAPGVVLAPGGTVTITVTEEY